MKDIMNIPMNDLKREYALLKDEIDEAMTEVLTSGRYIGGEVVERFEKNWTAYLGSEHVISCANGTDALLIAFMALDLQRGDEIIMPAYGYIAAAESAVLLGLVPVLVDVGADYNLDVSLIEDAISSKTKAILPLHLFGKCADMQAIMTTAKRHNFYIIEDAAQASGGSVVIDSQTYMAGTVGTIGCFSHFPTKNLGCFGDGGSICTNDSELAQKIRRIKKHGQSAKYIHKDVGVNSRLDALQAAILNVKLKYLDQHNDRRRAVAKTYSSTLKHPEIKAIDFESTHTYHQYPCMVNPDQRDAIKARLSELGVASTTYYPKVISEQEAMLDKVIIHSDKRSKELALSNLCLPISPTITDEEVGHICNVINYKL